MAKLSLISRLILGLLFLVFGLNGFFNFLPMPPMEGPSGAFAQALAATGYMFPMIKGIEVFCGLLFLTGFYVPLAVVLLAPISINILLFHVMLTPPNQWIVAIGIIVLQLIVAFSRWSNFKGLLQAK
jgi:uncharacterized membrane protein YphA (DoxX/SURF4 family)